MGTNFIFDNGDPERNKDSFTINAMQGSALVHTCDGGYGRQYQIIKGNIFLKH